MQNINAQFVRMNNKLDHGAELENFGKMKKIRKSLKIKFRIYGSKTRRLFFFCIRSDNKLLLNNYNTYII